MKVTISVRDPVFAAAERVARRMRLSRSRFYAKAIETYTKANSDNDITEQLNRVYSKHSSKLDPALEAVSLGVLRRERWR